jgi:hypothetical protein
MPHFTHTRIGESETPPEFPSPESLEDDNSQLAETVEDPAERKKLSPQLEKIQTADQRRAFFANKDARKSITFGPNVGSVACFDFLPVFHVNDITSGFAIPVIVRISSRQTSVTDSSSSVRSSRSGFREESPSTSPSIGTVSRSSLFVANDGNFQTTEILELRKGFRGKSSFGAFPSN